MKPRRTPSLDVRELTPETWPDLEALFEARGGPSYCWCLLWRADKAEQRDPSAPARKAGLKRRVDGGVPVGLVGYVDGEPVAWCSVAPRSTFQPGLAPARDGDDPERVWSLTCTFVRRDHRRSGVQRALVEAAARHARARGATVLEAYPVDPDSPSYRFGGFVPTFEKLGFAEVGRVGSRRHVMRLALGE